MITDLRVTNNYRRESDRLEKIELLNSLNVIDKYVIRSITDIYGTIIDVSQAFCDVTGYSRVELLGKSHSLLRSPDTPSKLYKDMWATIKSGTLWEGTIQNRKKDGSLFWIDIHIEPNINSKGDIVSYTSIINDITNKKILEQELEKNKAIITFVDSGIGTITLDGTFLELNGAFEILFGYTKSQLIGRNFIDFVRDDYIDIVKKYLKVALDVGALVKIKIVFKDKNNNDLFVEFSLDMLPDKKSFVMIINSLNDKIDLIDLNNSLENRIEKEILKNTIQLELTHKEKLKNVKLRAINSLASGVTHEINTPLAYIKGSFEMLRYDIEDLPKCTAQQNILEDAKKIADGINRIENIVKSMREVSQVSSEQKDIVDLYDTLITALTINYNRSKHISKIYLNGKLFTLDYDRDKSEKYFVEIQRSRLEQVWIIIITNALDELVKIEEYENRVLNIDIFKDNRYVVVRFKDNAGGIDSKIIDNIFEPFVSIKDHCGIGVGLNIAYNIIVEHDGMMNGYNEDDGAVFEVRLILKDKEK